MVSPSIHAPTYARNQQKSKGICLSYSFACLSNRHGIDSNVDVMIEIVGSTTDGR